MQHTTFTYRSMILFPQLRAESSRFPFSFPQLGLCACRSVSHEFTTRCCLTVPGSPSCIPQSTENLLVNMIVVQLAELEQLATNKMTEFPHFSFPFKHSCLHHTWLHLLHCRSLNRVWPRIPLPSLASSILVLTSVHNICPRLKSRCRKYMKTRLSKLAPQGICQP